MKDQASYFFNLAKYLHAPLFEPKEKVWQALSKISQYLSSATLGKIEIDIPSNVYLINPDKISIGKGSILEPGSYIKGPCILGENCVVRHGAYIRGDFIAGNNCVIGHDTEIKNSIFLDNVHAAHFAYLGDSILGNYVNLGAGTKCANLKFDHSHVYVSVEGRRVDSGMKKFGAIIGDFSQTGCNSVTNPGTLLGQNVFCYPCLNIGGFVPSNHVIKSNVKTVITPKE